MRRQPACVWDSAGEVGVLPAGHLRLHGPKSVRTEEGAGLSDLGTAA